MSVLLKRTKFWIFLVYFIAKTVSSDTGEECNCPSELEQVCGSNNITYDNLCAFDCSKRNNSDVFLLHNGTCCPLQECPGNFPICDNFGKTHPNECTFQRVACVVRKSLGIILAKLHEGPCHLEEKAECPTECPEIFDPVCDKDDNVYDNICRFEAIKCELKKSGKTEIALSKNTTSCLEKLQRPRQKNEQKRHIMGAETQRFYGGSAETYSSPPIGKSQDHSYLTSFSSSYESSRESDREKFSTSSYASKFTTTQGYQVFFSAESTLKLLDTTTVQPVSLPKIIDLASACSSQSCEKTWMPVCDTQNRTHKNMCLFKFYACQVNRIDGSTVDIAHEGPCQKPTKPSICLVCPKDEMPVPLCDNMNMTHNSLCEFIQFNCNQRNIGDQERVLVHVKACHARSGSFDLKDEKCPENCTDERRPVCDEANNTHENLCHFQQYNCNMRKLNIRAPYLRYLRPCSKKQNSMEVNPLHVNATVLDVVLEDRSTSGTKRVTNATSELTTVIFSSLEKESTRVTTPNVTAQPEVAEQTVPTTTKITPVNSTIDEEFDCPRPNCPMDGLPVCDSRGSLHGNLCEFTYSRCLAARVGEQLHISAEENCVSKAACQMPCTDDPHPICASDFSTYDNLCHFRKQKCLDSNLDVLFKGRCSECLDSPCPPPPSDAPDDIFVCVEDGTTRSLCEYHMLSCIFERGYGVNLSVNYVGKCCPKDEVCENVDVVPICGSNGRFYASSCELDIDNCKNKKLDLPLVKEADLQFCDGSLNGEGTSFESKEDDLSKIEKFEASFNCSSICGNTYEPLCGSDDVTYSNECTFHLAQCNSTDEDLQISYRGECCNSHCPNDFSPVCDNKNKTHQNMCKFGTQQCIMERSTGELLQVSKFEICEEAARKCDLQCPKEYVPVCATNGETVVNECVLNRFNCLVLNNITSGVLMEKAYNGQCCDNSECELNFSPVCDSSGVTHANECILNKKACVEMKKFGKNITIAYKGQCCEQTCPKNYEPVCDGKNSHDNLCRFREAQCKAERLGESLSVAYQGECCSLPEGECRFSGTVCDSDGQTHASQCWFMQRKCVVERIFGKPLNIVHNGECCVLKSCPESDEPVCDSRGTTHSSICHFQNTKCIYDKIHSRNASLEFDYFGACCIAGCTDEVQTICDQNGTSYQNPCFFKYRACQNWQRTQQVLHSTPCSST